jgi:hypothetical protein
LPRDRQHLSAEPTSWGADQRSQLHWAPAQAIKTYRCRVPE